jgi:hypothetical protein
MRNEHPFLVIVPASSLDDADLPVPQGTSATGSPAAVRQRHLAELGRRLQPMGIALAAI